MKKTIIISGLMLLTLSAFAQRPTRERTQQETRKHRSETTVKRTSPARDQHAASRTRTSSSREYNSATRSGTIDRTRTQRPDYTARNTESSLRKPVDRTQENRNKGNQYVRKPTNRSGNTTSNHGRSYYTPKSRQHVRNAHPVVKHYSPARNRKRDYRSPGNINLYWTHNMYRDYRIMYPDFHYWNYHIGYRILSVPAYNAYFHMNEVRNVYGRIYEVWYSWKTDEYFMYFGASYPYQDFTVVMPGKYARRYSIYPESYFSGRYIWVTGLVSTFAGKPEIMVMRRSQVHLY